MAAMERAIVPSAEQLKALVQKGPKGTLVMVNLLKFRVRAAYSEDRAEARENLSGRDAYLRYGAVAQKCVAEAGGGIVWGGNQALVAIGDEGDAWDHVVCVRYPSVQAFLAMVSRPEYQAASYHRDAALERTALLCCEAGSAA
jgi:uncharacterized protein (DUF1330 family)